MAPKRPLLGTVIEERHSDEGPQQVESMYRPGKLPRVDLCALIDQRNDSLPPGFDNILEKPNKGKEIETITDTVMDEVVVNRDLSRDLWRGSSLHQPLDHLDALSETEFRELTETHTAAYERVKDNPLEPEGWLCLATSYKALYNGELCAASAYLALQLINSLVIFPTLHDGEPTPQTESFAYRINSYVLIRTAKRLGVSIGERDTIDDEMERLRVLAYRILLAGLHDCMDWYVGALEARTAMEYWPEDEEFAGFEKTFKLKHSRKIENIERIMDDRASVKEIIDSRQGQVYKRRYAWMDPELFEKPQDLLDKTNSLFRRHRCEFRPLSGNVSPSEKANDVGPFGVFAKTDIPAGSTILIDKNIMFTSNVFPRLQDNCEVCHASLCTTYLCHAPIIASCCRNVAYCSSNCLKAARNGPGFHKKLCGKDFSWLYQSAYAGGGVQNPSWLPLLFLRFAAIVLSHDTWQAKYGTTPAERAPMHPLKHPEFAKLSAGYTSQAPSKDEKPVDWSLQTHVVYPMRILHQLGVDVFRSREWAPEVIETIMWRLSNNMCVARSFTVNYSGVPTAHEVIGIMPKLLCFNRTCEDANVLWHTRMMREMEHANLDWLRENLKRGSAAIVCVAKRDIAKDEQLTISYIDDSVEGTRLASWFPGGCKCAKCVQSAPQAAQSE